MIRGAQSARHEYDLRHHSAAVEAPTICHHARIIAATAQFFSLDLVTSNTRHFDWIGGLQLSDWRQP
jgi:predicted nucleic acid-binding protein